MKIFAYILIFVFLILASMCLATTYTGLYHLENGVSDSSGNARNGTANGSFTYVTGYPKPLQGSYCVKDNTAGDISIPTSVFTDLQSAGHGSVGVHFFCGEDQFNADSGLVSWAGAGGDGLIYTQWNGGNRNIVFKIGSSGGTQFITSANGSWQIGRWYDIWMDISASKADCYIRDFAMNTITKLGTITTSVSIATISQVNIGSYNGINKAKAYIDEVWFTATEVGAVDPFITSTNWEPGKKAWAYIHSGDSSVMGYGCTPTAADYWYTGGERPWMEIANFDDPTSLIFYSIGAQVHDATDPISTVLSSPMDEGFSGETSPNGYTHLINDLPTIFPNGVPSGVGVIFVLGGYHGDCVSGFGGPYSEAQVRTQLNSTVAYLNIAYPDAKIVYEPNYIINSGGVVCGTQNLGMHDSFKDQQALGRPVYYFNVTGTVNLSYLSGTCDDTTHPMVQFPAGFGYVDLGNKQHAFLASIVATPTPISCMP